MRGLTRVIGIFIFLVNIVLGKTIIGIGIGRNEVTAKEMALKDLSDNIYVDVIAESESSMTETEDDFSLDNNIKINSFSKNFLLGVKYKISKSNNSYKVKAILDDESFKIYRDKIDKIDKEIDELYSYNGDLKERLEYLKEIELKLEDRKKLEDVLVYIGVNGKQKNDITIGKLRREISTINAQLSQRKKLYIDLKGEVGESDRKGILNDIKRASKDNRLILAADDRGIDYYVDIEILELENKKIPKTAIKPERYVTSYNCNLVVINEKSGKEVLLKSISNKIEGYNKRLTQEEVRKALGEEIFNVLNNNLL